MNETTPAKEGLTQSRKDAKERKATGKEKPWKEPLWHDLSDNPPRSGVT